MPKKDIKQSLGLGAPIEEAVKRTKELNTELAKTEGIGNRLIKSFKSLATSMASAKPGGLLESQIAYRPPSSSAVTVKDSRVSSDNTGGPNGPSGPTDGSTGAGGGSGFSRFVSNLTGASTPGAAAMGLMGVSSGALNSAQQYIYQQLATSRLGFYGLGGAAGGTQQAYGNVTNLFNKLNQRGIITDQQDTLRAMVSSQRQGLAGGSQAQFGNMMEGFAVASAATPGLGVAGASQAAASMYSGRTTNQLLTAGIRTRNADGTLRPVTDIVNDIWSMMNRVKGKQGDITVNDLNTLLTPGFTLARFLDFYFGADSALRQNITDMLYIKAETKGAKLSNLNLKELQQSGAVTGAVVSGSKRTAAGAAGLAAVAPQAVKGIEFGNQVATSLANLANAAQEASGLVGVFAQGSMAMQTIGGIGNNTVGNFLSSIPIIGKLFKAEGGPVDERSPYIVGEKGPELFVPKTDGVIIPNHELNNPFREGGGGATAGGMKITNPTDFAEALIKGLGGKPTPQSVSNVLMWYSREGGNWNNTASFNPLNTSWKTDSSVNYNSKLSKTSKYYKDPSAKGVQAYTSWEEGLKATVDTLKKGNTSYNYGPLISALVGGKTSNTEFLKLMQGSSWDAGRYKGAKPSTGGTTSTQTQTITPTTQAPSRALSGAVAQDFAKNGGGGVTNNFNGGINIKVTGKADAKQISSEVKKAMEDLIKNKTLGTK